jgi:TfoX/Sxy family transcriptional regulator of competence genes
MAYSTALSERVRRALGARRGLTEKKMFGGLGFLLRGNLCVAVWQADLIARLGPEEAEAALAEPGVRPFDVTGRPMRGWVLVDAEVVDSDEALGRWIERALEFAARLPAK